MEVNAKMHREHTFSLPKNTFPQRAFGHTRRGPFAHTLQSIVFSCRGRSSLNGCEQRWQLPLCFAIV
jgi:hypothetical protein